MDDISRSFYIDIFYYGIWDYNCIKSYLFGFGMLYCVYKGWKYIYLYWFYNGCCYNQLCNCIENFLVSFYSFYWLNNFYVYIC